MISYLSRMGYTNK